MNVMTSSNCTISKYLCRYQYETELKLQVLALTQESGFWKFEHEQAKRKIEKQAETIAELEGEIKKFQKRLFGKKSEKSNKTPNGQKTSNKNKRGQKRGSKGHGRNCCGNLPIQEEEIKIDKDKIYCKCGLPYERIESSEDYEVIEIDVKAYKRRIKKEKRKKTCSCCDCPPIITAKSPKTEVIPRSKYGNSFWIKVLLTKYLLHNPINRFINESRLLGFHVSPGTITGGLKSLLPILQPISAGIKAENLRSHHWHADETRWLIFVNIPGKKNQNCWLWVFKTSTTVVFVIAENRGGKVPKEHYGKDSLGVISADRYVVYKALIKTGRFIIAFCWVHVRRDFLEASIAQKGTQFADWALNWVEKIGELYHLNNERLKHDEGSQEFKNEDKKLRSAVEEMKERYEKELKNQDRSKCNPLPKSCKKVLESLKNHWSGLILFVDHPWIPMDNNTAERTIRGPIIGRKGYFGSGSMWSAELSAVSWSIFSTMALWGINQKLWCEDYFNECALLGGKAPSDITKYLPWNMSDDQLVKYGANPDKRPHEKARLCGSLSTLEDNLEDKQTEPTQHNDPIKTEIEEDFFYNQKFSSINRNPTLKIFPKEIFPLNDQTHHPP